MALVELLSQLQALLKVKIALRLHILQRLLQRLLRVAAPIKFFLKVLYFLFLILNQAFAFD